jgi:hypothetical protein
VSIETLDKILERELSERRRGRVYFAALALAVLVILVAMVTM